MADFTILDSQVLNSGQETSYLTNEITPAVGDVIVFSGSFSAGTGAAVSGGGMTWEQVGATNTAGSSFVVAFEAVSGTPAAGQLTIAATDSFADPTYAVVRPVDLGEVSLVGSANSSGLDVDTLDVTLTTDEPGGLLAYFRANRVGTFTQDDTNGFTEILDANVSSGGAHQLQEKFADASAVVGDCSGADAPILGICLQFASVEVGSEVSQTLTASAEHTEAVTSAEIIITEHTGTGVISGSVVLDADSTPVESALVVAVRQSSGEVEVTGQTDVNGDFALDAVEPGLFDVYVRRTDSLEALAQTTVTVD